MLYGKRRQLARAGCAAQQALARQAASTERRFSLLACAPAGVMTLMMYSAPAISNGEERTSCMANHEHNLPVVSSDP